MADNTITVTGTLGKDPELSYTPSGAVRCQFSIAVNRSWTDRNTNEKKQETSWFNVLVWGQLAENVAASLVKGTRAFVSGRLEQRQFEAKDGTKRDWIEIVADAVGPDLRWATAQIDRNERDTKASSSRSTSTSTAPAFEDTDPF